MTPWRSKFAKAAAPCNVHALIAVGVNGDGGREVLGLDVAATEDGAGWLAFLRSLTARGLSGTAPSVRWDHEVRHRTVIHPCATDPIALLNTARKSFERELLGARTRRRAPPFPVPIDPSLPLCAMAICERIRCVEIVVAGSLVMCVYATLRARGREGDGIRGRRDAAEYQNEHDTNCHHR